MGNVSRRTFLIGGAALTAGTVAGLTACSPKSEPGVTPAEGPSTGEGSSDGLRGMQTLSTGADIDLYLPEGGAEPSFREDVIDASLIAEEIDCDLVVCGAGLSGNCTALAAASEGLNVVVLEKGASIAFRGSQIAGLDDRLHKEAGIEFDKDFLLEDAMRSNGYRCNREIWQKWIELQGQAVDWILEETADVATPFLTNPDVKNGVHSIAGINEFFTIIKFEEGMEVFAKGIQQKAESYGAKYYWETGACQLVKDDSSGDIVGVIAQNPDGNFVKFNTSKGVALCTGSYDFNQEMMKEWCRQDDLAAYSWTNPVTTNVGDGHMMGMAAGGVMDPYPHVVMIDPGGMASHQRNLATLFPFMRVNQNGKRFVREGLPSEYMCDAIMHQPGNHCWILFSGNIAENLGKTNYREYTSFSRSTNTPEEVVDELMPDLIEAESIEQLAEKTGMDAENLKVTLERAHELYELGEDLDFGADPGMLMPWDKGPYYACDEGGSGLCVVSGLRVTAHSEVVDQNGSPIAGLYAVGNASGDMFYGTYPHHISGISHSRCVVFGYALGKRLAGALAEKE